MAGARLKIRLTPRASREAIEGCPDGSFKAWVRAAPTDGQANEALIRLVAKRLGVAPSRVQIERGHSGRSKELLIEGLALDACLAQLQAPE